MPQVNSSFGNKVIKLVKFYQKENGLSSFSSAIEILTASSATGWFNSLPTEKQQKFLGVRSIKQPSKK